MAPMPQHRSLDGTPEQAESEHQVGGNKDDQSESDRTQDAEDYGPQGDHDDEQWHDQRNRANHKRDDHDGSPSSLPWWSVIGMNPGPEDSPVIR